MKTCSKCGEEKAESEFTKRTAAKDGLQSRCKACYVLGRTSYYTRDRLLLYRKRSLLKRQRAMFDYLLLHPCVDCTMADVRVLDFDHIDPSVKKFNIGKAVKDGLALETIMEEITQCEVRCANCHRIRTSKQFGWNKETWWFDQQ